MCFFFFEGHGDHRDLHSVERRQRQMCIRDRRSSQPEQRGNRSRQRGRAEGALGRPVPRDPGGVELDTEAAAGSAPDEIVRTAERVDARLLVLGARGAGVLRRVGLGLALAQGADWALVLNEGTVLRPGCVAALVAAGEADPAVGLAGPLIVHADEPGVIQSAGGVLDRQWRAQHLGANEPDRGQFAAPRDRMIGGMERAFTPARAAGHQHALRADRRLRHG